ncbi:unnamed protein product [Euphydryas editha]|uniref:THAP-type domain-containing protein n=1 Tax=Euphydryas editha TaxID=104508 RepID=A0AAU9UMA7_EUPED|nr:unnamed protein product [Euphydryas editha]
MPKKCCIPNCRVQQDDPDGLRLSFYKIPADENLKKQWLESIKQHCDIDLNKYSFVCSRHFEKECFGKTFSWLKNGKLKKGCCPTIFLNYKNFRRYGAVYGRKILKDGCLPTLHLTKNDIKKESDNSVDIVQEISTDTGLLAAHLHTEVNIEDDLKHEPTSESDDEDMKISKESCSLKEYSRESYGAVYGRKILKDGCLPTLHLTKNDIKKESDNSVDIVQEISTDTGLLAAHLHTEVNIEDDLKHEPTSESDDEDMKISKESCSLKEYSRERKLNPETSPNNSELVNPKTIISPSTNLPLYQTPAPQTTSQDPSTQNKIPTNLKENSFNSNPISPQENSSYFQFFRNIHSDYLELSAKKKRCFKKQCLNLLYNLLDDDDTDHKISTYSQDNVKLRNSGHSEENKDVNPFAEDEYILPNN